MANQLQVDLLNKDVSVWNDWREANYYAEIDLLGAEFIDANLRGANLREANLIGAKLSGANLSQANLSGAWLKESDLSKANLTDASLQAVDFSLADLTNANLSTANLTNANLSGANLSNADLSAAFLYKANLSQAILINAESTSADFYGANLSAADLRGGNFLLVNFSLANLTKADLSGACLIGASFVMTIIAQAKFSNCRIYGLSVWDLKGVPERQENLVITPPGQAEITVDDLEVAQFIYLLLKNEKLKNVIDTITSKAVLILGRFTEERLASLTAIREELRKHNLTPILFDFDKPTSKDVTGTVETLARMARFIIADLTDPSSIAHELATIVKDLRTTPIQPIKLKGTTGYSMLQDYYGSYKWLLKPYVYKDQQSLIASLPKVIAPANKMADSFRKKKRL
jgi:uncharacterized protein YjbI with pentapeptide repeats